MRISCRLIWESSRIAKNQWELVSDLFENHQESTRITRNQYFRLIWEYWESLRIAKNQWESVSDLFKYQWVSPRIIKNHWESLRIAENHMKNKVLPLQWSKAKWCRYMKITVFIVILIDSDWFSLILQIILIFPLSQINRHRPHSCPCRQQW